MNSSVYTFKDKRFISDLIGTSQGISPRANNTFNQVAEAKRFEGVFLCRKVCMPN